MTSPAALLLYVDPQYVSPYAMSAFVALHEKALPFEMLTVDLAGGAQHQPAYVRQSLTQRVPTLLHGDFSLSESSAIAEYLDEVFPGTPLYPADPRQRARARQVQAWLRSDLPALRQDRTTEVLFYGPSDKPLSPAGQLAADKLFAAADALLEHGGEHLFDQWSIADVDLALMLNRLLLNGDPVPERLAVYAGKQWQQPSVQLWCGLVRPGR